MVYLLVSAMRLIGDGMKARVCKRGSGVRAFRCLTLFISPALSSSSDPRESERNGETPDYLGHTVFFSASFGSKWNPVVRKNAHRSRSFLDGQRKIKSVVDTCSSKIAETMRRAHDEMDMKGIHLGRSYGRSRTR